LSSISSSFIGRSRIIRAGPPPRAAPARIGVSPYAVDSQLTAPGATITAVPFVRALVPRVHFHIPPPGDPDMRRDAFLKTLAALAAAGALPLSARAAANLKMMIPANPGGGWDSTGRALGKALQEAGVASAVTYENKGGAAGAIGLAQFVNAAKGDPNALIMMGQVMIGGIITGKPPVSITQCTPIARLTSEYTAFVLPAQSPLKTMKDVVEQMKKDPASVKWGGGSRGSTEHITIAMIAREVGVDPAKINYVPFRGGGEAVAAILGNNVTVGASGYSEFQQYIESGKMRAIAMASPARQKGINVPTLKELGINVELGNWRGVYGAPGITEAQRKALTDAVLKATKTKSWLEALDKNNWTPAVMSGKEFDEFVDREFASLRATMFKAGML
jgi:putative tricarboxylic transport membrane protein